MAWANVQNTVGNPVAATTTALAFGSSVTSGNLLVVSFTTVDTTNTVSSVTDTVGSTWALASGPIVANSTQTSWIYYALANASGANTVTVHWSGTATAPNIFVAEFSGNATSSPRDKFTSSANTGTAAITSGSTATLTNAAD